MRRPGFCAGNGLALGPGLGLAAGLGLLDGSAAAIRADFAVVVVTGGMECAPPPPPHDCKAGNTSSAHAQLKMRSFMLALPGFLSLRQMFRTSSMARER
jgi:hypothetical protein